MTFLFDENMPQGLAEALAALGEKALHLRDVPDLGRADVEWLRHAGAEGWCVITRDVAILRKPDERAALTAHGVGAFFVPPGDETRCDLVRLVVRHWPEIKRTARKTARPFIMEIRENGVRPLRHRR